MSDDAEPKTLQTNNPYNLKAPGARHNGQFNLSEDGRTIVASCSCRWHAEPVEIEQATTAEDRTRVMVEAANAARPLLDEHLRTQVCPRCAGQGQLVDPNRPWIEPQTCPVCFGSRTCLPKPPEERE